MESNFHAMQPPHRTVKQVLDILGGIFDLLGGQRPQSPIGQRLRLVEILLAQLLDKRRVSNLPRVQRPNTSQL
jgi:hypothetical protein